MNLCMSLQILCRHITIITACIMSFWSVSHFSILNEISDLQFTRYDTIFSITYIAYLGKLLSTKISIPYVREPWYINEDFSSINRHYKEQTTSPNIFYDDLRSNLLEMMIFVMPAEIFRKMKLPKRYTRNSNRCEHFPVVLFLTVVKMSTHGIFYTVYDQCIFTKFF